MIVQGIFPMRGNYFIGGKGKRVKNKFFTNELSYKAYKKAWSVIENVAEEINVNMFKQILSDLQNYIGNIRDDIRNEITSEIPTAILLTGENRELIYFILFIFQINLMDKFFFYL